MAYINLLVAVAPSPESNELISMAVAIARPVQGKIRLITQAGDPEIYNQFAAPMLADVRRLMHEETMLFLEQLAASAEYPVADTLIVSGDLSKHVAEVCLRDHIDLIICGNHNQTLFNKLTCTSHPLIALSCADVLLVALK